VITKEALKAEIDKVPDEHLGVLFRIVKALEEPARTPEAEVRKQSEASWKAWLAEAYGSTAGAPIELGPSL